MAELAAGRELHAAHLDHLADQSFGLGFCPKDFALCICETGANGTPGRCDEAQPAAMLAPPFGVSGDKDIVRLIGFDFDPLVALTKDKTLVAVVIGALQLGEDVVGCGICQVAPMETGVEWLEAVDVFRQDGRFVPLWRSRPRCPYGVAKRPDEYLAVAGASANGRWNVVERLVGAAQPAFFRVKNCPDAIDFEADQPVTRQGAAIPRTGASDFSVWHLAAFL